MHSSTYNMLPEVCMHACMCTLLCGSMHRFAPLTGLEVMSSRVVGSVLVVMVRLSVNLSALTMDQVVSKRRKVVMDMCANVLGGEEVPH